MLVINYLKFKNVHTATAVVMNHMAINSAFKAIKTGQK